MLAVVKEHQGPGFSLRDVPTPSLRYGDVLVRVRSVGICGSDVPILAGTRAVPWPLIPGHEFAGDVAEVGPGVDGFKAGDRVTSCLVIGCGNCRFCVSGAENLCDHLVETGIHVNGAFAEYVRVPAKTLLKLRDGTSYDVGASIDPVASAWRTVKALGSALISPLDTAVVFGPGPIGLYAAQLLKLRGACVISVGADGDEAAGRLALASKFADHVIDSSKESVAERVAEITNGRGADAVQDCTGAPPVVDCALNVLRPCGTFAITGLFHRPVETNLGRITRAEIKVFGTICYTRREFAECLEMVERGQVVTEPLVTHRFALSEIDRAWEVIQAKRSIKIMLHP
ncbi:MAG: alcohol dehydrogenase catalytic domain-containing protein [Synergistaceae bacterium]|nr:alcohol dehydrogenase catalytic domain-containing protein [Synergistaceae bacterium]